MKTQLYIRTTGVASDTVPWSWPRLCWALRSGPDSLAGLLGHSPIVPCTACWFLGGVGGSYSKSQGPLHLGLGILDRLLAISWYDK